MKSTLYVRTVVADLRAEPDDRAERVSQAIFLTPLWELERQEGWRRVRTPDGYEGWVRASHVDFLQCPEPQWKVTLPVVEVHEEVTGRMLGLLPLDTRLPGTPEAEGIRLLWPNGCTGIIPTSAVRPCAWTGGIRDLLNLAQSLVGIPYLWGGTSTFGFDCSGFVQRVFHFVFNLWLPRDSRDQRNVGLHIPDFSRIEPGDLLFFPGHVGLWLGGGWMVHASAHAGQVTRTCLEPPEDSYARRLRKSFEFGRRVIGLLGPMAPLR